MVGYATGTQFWADGVLMGIPALLHSTGKEKGRNIYEESE